LAAFNQTDQTFYTKPQNNTPIPESAAECLTYRRSRMR
jgi:hypothetical protein